MNYDYEYDEDGRPAVTERFNASVTVALAEPHLCRPVNSAPGDAYVVLPDGGAIQVTGEDEHMHAIVPLLQPEGECWAYATLRAARGQSARGTKDLVEVRLNGECVGRLTPKMSGDLLPAVRHLEELALVTAAKARIRGNRLKAEVVLHCARAHELPSDCGPGRLAVLGGRVIPIDLSEPHRAIAPREPDKSAPNDEVSVSGRVPGGGWR